MPRSMLLLLFPRQNAKVNVVLNRVIRENTWLMGSMLLSFPSQLSFLVSLELAVINQIVSRECLTDDVKLINVFGVRPELSPRQSFDHT